MKVIKKRARSAGRNKVLEYFHIHAFGDWPSDKPFIVNMKSVELMFEPVLKFSSSNEGAIFLEKTPTYFSNPDNFTVMKSKYAQWSTGLMAGTVSDYRRRIKNALKSGALKPTDFLFLLPGTSTLGDNRYLTTSRWFVVDLAVFIHPGVLCDQEHDGGNVLRVIGRDHGSCLPQPLRRIVCCACQANTAHEENRHNECAPVARGVKESSRHNYCFASACFRVIVWLSAS